MIAQAFNRQFTACSVPQDRTIRVLLRVLHHHHCVDPSYRQFDVKGVAVAMGALPLPRGLIGIPCYTFAIWGSTEWPSWPNFSTSQSPELISRQFGRTLSWFLSWKQGSPVSKAAPIALIRILEQLLQATIVEALRIRLSKHGFKPRHSPT